MRLGKVFRGVLLASLIFALVFTAFGCGASTEKKEASNEPAKQEEKPIVMKFSHVTSPDSPKGKAAQKFAELMEERTNGRVKVEVYPSSQLYGDKEEVEALQAGNVHIIAPTAAKMVGFVPSFQVFDLPFLFKDNQATYKAFSGELAEALFAKLEPQGLKGLGFWANGFKQFTSSKKLIKSPADAKGQKFRTMAGKVLEAQFKAVGGAGVVIPFSETYAAMQQGTVDAGENTWNNIDTQKFYEVQKYITESNHGRLDYVVLTNADFFNSLPEDIQQIMLDTMKEVTEYEWQLAEELDKQSKENIIKSGKNEIYTLTAEERAAFEKAMAPVYEEMESLIGKDIIELAKKANQ